MELLLHPRTARLYRDLAAAPGGLLFYGAAGMGKQLAALALARTVNGVSVKGSVNNHPDIILLDSEDESIGVAAVRELQQKLVNKPYYSESTRVVIVADAQRLTAAAQNALLKTLEEPPPRTRLILTATSLDDLLPTVRSRLVAVYFAPVGQTALAEWLVTSCGVSADDAQRAAALADGAPGLASTLAAGQDAAPSRPELDQSADLALSAPLFDKLKLARTLAEDKKLDLAALARRLHVRSISDTAAPTSQPERSSSHELARRLEAIDRFRRRLLAGVTRRASLESLMLELSNV